PLVLLLPSPGAAPWRQRIARAAPLLGVGAVLAIALAATGAGPTHLGGEAYARGFGSNLFMNLMTYMQWSVDLGDPFPGQVSAIAGDAWRAGIVVTLGLALLVVLGRRAAVPPAPA